MVLNTRGKMLLLSLMVETHQMLVVLEDGSAPPGSSL